MYNHTRGKLYRQPGSEQPAGPIITYIPGEAVAKLAKPSVIVSICGQFDQRPAIDEKHTVHNLTFDIGSWTEEAGKQLKAEQIEALLKFCEEQAADKDIIVHCTAGECRSYTIATLLSIHLESKHVLRRHEYSASTNYMDRRTERIFHDYIMDRDDKASE